MEKIANSIGILGGAVLILGIGYGTYEFASSRGHIRSPKDHVMRKVTFGFERVELEQKINEKIKTYGQFIEYAGDSVNYPHESYSTNTPVKIMVINEAIHGSKREGVAYRENQDGILEIALDNTMARNYLSRIK